MVIFQQVIQQLPWWQSAAFGNAMITLVLALGGYITARLNKNSSKLESLEKNTNGMQNTITTQHQAIVAAKDEKISQLEKRTGGTPT
jgi:hypothetical protein